MNRIRVRPPQKRHVVTLGQDRVQTLRRYGLRLADRNRLFSVNVHCLLRLPKGYYPLKTHIDPLPQRFRHLLNYLTGYSKAAYVFPTRCR